MEARGPNPVDVVTCFFLLSFLVGDGWMERTGKKSPGGCEGEFGFHLFSSLLFFLGGIVVCFFSSILWGNIRSTRRYD